MLLHVAGWLLFKVSPLQALIKLLHALSLFGMGQYLDFAKASVV